MAKNEYTLGQARMGGRGGGRFRVAEKPKDFKTAIAAMMRYATRFAPLFIGGLSCAIFATALTLFGPDRLGKITRYIEAGMNGQGFDLDGVVRTTTLLLLFYLASSLLTYGQSFLLITGTQRMLRSLRSEISHKLNRLPLSRYDSASFGDLLSRVTNDVDTIGESFNNAIAQLVTATVLFVGCVVLMLVTNLILGAVAITASLVGFFLMNQIIKRSQKFFSARQRYLGELNGHIEEIYAAHNIVKAFNGEEQATEEFSRLNQLLFESNWKSQFLSGIMGPMMEFIGNFGYLAVCVLGAVMTKNGQIGFDVIVAFIVYVKLFTQPLGQVAQSFTSLQSAAAASERVFSFLAEPEMEDESGKTKVLEAKNGEVEFEHVNFGYVPGRTIIHDFSAVIRPGMKVAIVGPTGAGKTTLVNLLMRFYELNGGRIKIDGVDISDITRENVHALFCMVLQDTWIFDGTVRENVVYSKENVSDETVEAACRAVGLHHFIQTLPQGYDTVLGDESSLSAGQRQLLTIARAMVEDAPLLILDEATSSVDTRTEVLVQRAMDQLTQGRTSFTIAHRLSTIRGADVILVMKDSDIIESGSHDELLAKNGFYAQLWQSQFVNAEAI